MYAASARRDVPGMNRRPYLPPVEIHEVSLSNLLRLAGRMTPETERRTMDLFGARGKAQSDPTIFYSGDLKLLDRPCVAVVGTREVSHEGAARARRVAKELVRAGVVVVSGLAMGVDTEAHSSALTHGGKTIAVLGTPLDKCSPSQNKDLQEELYTSHLIISQFSQGSTVYPANFPQRNRLMAAVTDATVIIEASDSSGTLHQAVECARLGRPLFIARSVAENKGIEWPSKFLREPNAHILSETGDILKTIGVS